MKKIISLCLLCMLVISNTFSVNATTDSSTTETETTVIDGTLINREVIAQTRSGDITSYADTYEYIIQPRGSGEASEDEWDSASVIHAYMTIYYTTTNAELGTEYLLTKVIGNWTSPTEGVTIQSSSVRYACVDIGHVSQLVTQNVSSPFSINTGFSTGILSWAPGASVGANLDITLYRGGSWNFTLQNNIVNNGV